MQTIHLEFPSSPEYIAVARNVVESLPCTPRLSADLIDDLKLAIGEACSNAVKFSKSAESLVHVLYRIKPERIEIEVRNRGIHFHRSKHRPSKPPIEDLREGGLGIYLIDQLMDEVVIQSRSGTTSIRMAKTLG